MLRDVVAQPTNHTAILALKAIPRGKYYLYTSVLFCLLTLISDENSIRSLANGLIVSTRSAVMQRFKKKKGKGKLLLETELYLEWLNELDYVVSAFDVSRPLVIYYIVSHSSYADCAECQSSWLPQTTLRPGTRIIYDPLQSRGCIHR
jgi:hypothetical protein